jgi:hypothetical protein
MNMERRRIFTAVAALFGATAARAALGCTLIGTPKRRRFSNEACLRRPI